MNLNNQPIVTLHDLLNHDASKFCAAESELNHQLSEWIKSARSLKLKNLLRKYKDFVEEHLSQMDYFVKDEKIKSLPFLNKVMMALIE